MKDPVTHTNLPVLTENQTSAILSASEALTRQTLTLQVPALQIQQIAMNYSQMLKAIDLSPLVQSMIELQKNLSGLQRTFDIFTFPKRDVYIAPPTERPEPVVIIKDISDQKADYIIERVVQRLEERMTNTQNVSLPTGKQESVVNLPSGASWESIKIAIESDDVVSVYFKDSFLKKVSREDLGLAKRNTRHREPSKAWHLLELLSLSNTVNGFSIDDILKGDAISNKMIFSKKGIVHSTRSTLATKLKEAFGIYEDPFYDYNHTGRYKLKFQLLPLPDLRQQELYTQSGPYDLREESYVEDD